MPRTERARILRWERPRHPLAAALGANPERVPVLAVRRVADWAIGTPDRTEVLMTAGAEEPLLMERAYGEGRTLMFGTTADRAWGDLPLSAHFLPLVQELVQYAAHRGGEPLSIPAGENVVLSEAAADALDGGRLLDPRGAPVPLRRRRVSSGTRWVAEALLSPGVYRAGRGTGARTPTPVLAVNAAREEADVTPVARGRLQALPGDPVVGVASGRDDLLRRVSEHRAGRSLDELLLWIVLALAVVEAMYSNYRARPLQAGSEGRR